MKEKRNEKKKEKLNNTCIRIKLSNHFWVKNNMHILRKNMKTLQQLGCLKT